MTFQFVSFCAFALLVQTVYGQAISGINLLNSGCGCGSSQGYGGYQGYGGSLGYGNNNIALGSQQGSASFGVSSAGPYTPSGINVLSENDISGSINVCGGLPFASAVAFESALPTAGEASLNYGCGNSVGLTSAGYGAGAGLGQAGLGQAGLGQAGLIGANNFGGFIGGGCGCNRF